MNTDAFDALDKILGPQGSLAGAIAGFEFRPSQLKLAKLVQKALRDKAKAVIEAGTGTGKTLGYLAPIVLSEKKTVISTGTKNLQEQIFYKDIPLLSRALGREIDAVMMKGRTNYLCLYRYDQHFLRPFLLNKDFEDVRGILQEWIERSQYGDRADWAGSRTKTQCGIPSPPLPISVWGPTACSTRIASSTVSAREPPRPSSLS
jgi:ATP-dependent DNA helicase DinG